MINVKSLQIAFFVPGMPFNGDTIKTDALGGSETAGLYMARELAARGHKVFMFCNTDKPGDYAGVIYRPAGEFEQFGPTVPHDVTIVQRMPEAFARPMNSKLNVLWCHDLALARSRPTFNAVTWNVDQVAVLSDYMAEQYKKVYEIPESLLFRTRNGIDLSLFDYIRETRSPVRDHKKLMYSARPERGLDVLLKNILPRLFEADPDLYLCVAGYSNTVDHMAAFYDECNALMKSYGPRVRFLGSLSKADLYYEYMTAGAYLYPTPSPIMPTFNEVSCITAMECQAAGLPIVTSHRGALPETIAPGAGILIDAEPLSADYVDQFVEAVRRVLMAPSTFDADLISATGHIAAQALDWSTIAAEWEARFIDQIIQRNESPRRLLEHFYKRSDIIAAEELIRRCPGLSETPTAR